MISSCVTGQNQISDEPSEKEIIVGAKQMELYVGDLHDLNVGIVANQTSLVDGVHLVDTLISSGVKIKRIFSPEHGFRGKVDAGEEIDDSFDKKTGLPIISLYGKNKKPFDDQLKGIDIMLFDIQDVGVRFYTYISTLHYVMEACAENGIKVIVMDRPNPNAHYVDGPVLDTNFRSFVGMHPVPIVYGMTIGEYAEMINGENWLKNGVKADLKVIPCQNYNHQKAYSLPVAPSPNLRTDLSIQLYPGLCLFEGTTVSVGRGTDHPFEQFGHPDFPDTLDSFTPRPSHGATNPKHKGETCYGFKLYETESDRIDHFELEYLIQAVKLIGDHTFIDNRRFFNLLAGTDVLADQLMNKLSKETIRSSWEPGLSNFKEIRKKYLIYTD